MSGRHHLREIDEHGVPRLSPDEDVELVKIAVNESGARETEDEGHESCIEVRRRVDGFDLTPEQVSDFKYVVVRVREVEVHQQYEDRKGGGVGQADNVQWERVDEGHDDAMPRLRNRDGHRKPMLIEHLQTPNQTIRTVHPAEDTSKDPPA